MSTQERKRVPDDQARQPEMPAAQGTAVRTKKAYRTPVLSKYEQLHGIGIGISE